MSSQGGEDKISYRSSSLQNQDTPWQHFLLWGHDLKKNLVKAPNFDRGQQNHAMHQISMPCRQKNISSSPFGFVGDQCSVLSHSYNITHIIVSSNASQRDIL